MRLAVSGAKLDIPLPVSRRFPLYVAVEKGMVIILNNNNNLLLLLLLLLLLFLKLIVVEEILYRLGPSAINMSTVADVENGNNWCYYLK